MQTFVPHPVITLNTYISVLLLVGFFVFVLFLLFIFFFGLGALNRDAYFVLNVLLLKKKNPSFLSLSSTLLISIVDLFIISLALSPSVFTSYSLSSQ